MNRGSKGEVPASSKTHTTWEVALRATFPGSGAGLSGKGVTLFQSCLEWAQWVGLSGKLTGRLRHLLADSRSQRKSTSVAKTLRKGSPACFLQSCLTFCPPFTCFCPTTPDTGAHP